MESCAVRCLISTIAGATTSNAAASGVLDSLLTGTGTDLDLQTFKLTDQLTGRMMGASADVTPQVARMDAHSLKRQGPVRLCY